MADLPKPKGVKAVSIVHEIRAKLLQVDKATRKAYATLLVDAMIDKAIAGDVRLMELLLDRVDGAVNAGAQQAQPIIIIPSVLVNKYNMIENKDSVIVDG